MKKLKLNPAKARAAELLTRKQLKQVMGGFPGSTYYCNTGWPCPSPAYDCNESTNLCVLKPEYQNLAPCGNGGSYCAMGTCVHLLIGAGDGEWVWRCV